MKTKIFIVATILFASILGINATPQVELKNPTENREFNTNETPFNEKRTEGLREEYNQFGQQQRHISVKGGSYDHYNQAGRQQSILGGQDAVVNRPQSATLNNNQYNYGNQNTGRKIDNSNAATRVSYNTPMSVEQISRRPISSAADEITIETGGQQNISFDKNTGKTEEGTLPTNPYEQPIGDAIPFVVMLAALYTFIIRRKQ